MKKFNFFALKPRFFVLLLFLVFLLAYLYIGQMYVTYGPSMEPTIYSGERIVVDKKAYSVVKPSKGDVVALVSPLEDRLYVKRVVAEASDVVESDSSGIKVNSKLLLNTEGPWGQKQYILKENEIFVLGDNRFISYDSRDFGPIKVNDIVGEVKMVVWPPSSWRIVR